MKKSLISLAVMAGMAASSAAFAEATVYGNVHLSINTLGEKVFDDVGAVDENDGFNMTSNTSAIGVKGSEDLGDGMKAIYKIEFQVDPDERDNPGSGGGTGQGALVDRDQWVGLKGGMGTVKFGTMSNNYKQMGGKIDPFYRTRVEGRGVLNMQSGLHGGAGEDGGRSTNTVQYSSPKMGGMQVVINRTFDNRDGTQAAPTPADPANTISDDETMGIGFRYQTKEILVYFDYLDPNAPGAGSITSATAGGTDETVTKIGGKFKTAGITIGAQLEQTEDQLGGDYIFLSGAYDMDKNNKVALTIGQQSDVSDSLAFGYMHKMGKKTTVYAVYGQVEADQCTAPDAVAANVGCTYDLGFADDGSSGVFTALEDNSIISFGIKKKF